MPDQLKINEELGIIEIRSYGEITVEEAVQSMDDCIIISKEKNINRIIVDTSELTKLPSTVGIFQFFSDFPNELVIAIVISKDSFIEDVLTFGENVAVNRGKKVKLFTDRNEALNWLHSFNSD